MRVVSRSAVMQNSARLWKRRGVPVGLVPTMGYLHAGHVSLVRAARKWAGPRGVVVLSIYVNPTQFAPTEDLARYPRDLQRDLKLCRAAGVDVVFAPTDAQMYPAGFSTYVAEEKLSRIMEGASRPTHFRGVTTVVAKLFNLVLPDAAVFGQKDFQQAAIIKRMAADLNFPLKIIVAPTVRERDGLAMSSRNKYLLGDLRRQATVLCRAIHAAQAAVKKNKSVPASKLKAALKKLVQAEPDARLDYAEFFDPETLAPAAKVTRGTRLALAAFVGKTRVIDNARL